MPPQPLSTMLRKQLVKRIFHGEKDLLHKQCGINGIHGSKFSLFVQNSPLKEGGFHIYTCINPLANHPDDFMAIDPH